MVATNLLLIGIFCILVVIAIQTSGLPTSKATNELFEIIEDIKNKLK